LTLDRPNDTKEHHCKKKIKTTTKTHPTANPIGWWNSATVLYEVEKVGGRRAVGGKDGRYKTSDVEKTIKKGKASHWRER